MTLDQKTIQKIRDNYKHNYTLMIDNKNLILRNIAYGSLGVFPNGEQVIRLSNKQVVQISAWL